MSVVTRTQGGVVVARDLYCDAGRYASARCVGAVALPKVDADADDKPVPDGWAARRDPFGRQNRHNGKLLKLHLCPQCVLASMPPEEPRVPHAEVGA